MSLTSELRPPAARRQHGDPTIPDELLSRAVAGDREAVAGLLGTIRPLVVRYCRTRLPSDRPTATPDDIAQEVCIAVLTALPRWQRMDRPFLAFVFGIAAHKVVDAHRESTRRRTDPVAHVPDAIAPGKGPAEHALHHELTGALSRLLDVLPASQREILVLRVAVGLSAEETALAVGSTPGAVRVAQHRALARVRTAVLAGRR
jgi:RNA polymerase sigma-70 factor (ECF subfamily)